MIPYLILISLLVPANLWASITPHLHSDLSMRLLHGVSTLVLLPPLFSMWHQRRQIQRLPALLLASFSLVLIVVNTTSPPSAWVFATAGLITCFWRSPA